MSTAERKDLLSCPVLNKDANNYHHEWDLKAVSENKAEKIQTCGGFKLMISVILVQCSTKLKLWAGRNENFNDVTT